MKLKIYKNKYGHDVVDCPFCSDFAYIKGSGATHRIDTLSGLKQHITIAAKNEALAIAVGGVETSRKHLDYYVVHTKPSRIPHPKRDFDYDMIASE